MPITTLKFFVRENGSEFPLSDMSEPECAAIGECVDDLVPTAWGSDYWFDSDTCIFDEDEDDDEMPAYGLLRCNTYIPRFENGLRFEAKVPHPIPKEVLDKLAGKSFCVQPRQLGLNPWGSKVEIRFEPVPVPPVPPVPNPDPEPEPSPAPAPAPAPTPPPAPARASAVQPKAGVPASFLIAKALQTQTSY